MQSFLEYVNGRKIEKKKLDKIGDYSIFIVNGSLIRDISQDADEFNDFGTHLTNPKLVPNQEIWIGKDVSKHERQFAIHNAIHQYEAKRKGIRNWYAFALKHERAEREKVDGLKFHPERTNKKPPKKVYVKYYCGIADPTGDVEVWIVDGRLMRDEFKTDAVIGGNSYVYSWIPNNEIWVEEDIEKEKGEVDITILHEYVESTLMKLKKMPYAQAHNIAAKVDWHHRGKWDITDVKSLNREKALEMAKKYL